MHIPVLVDQMYQALSAGGGGKSCTYVDATFGGGGYSRFILERCEARLIAIDQDPDAKNRAEELVNAYPNRFTFLKGNFSKIDTLLGEDVLLDGIVFDLGVSSFQFDEAERGFSYRFDAPLDMRMSKEGFSAFDVVNHYCEDHLFQIIWRYGEETRYKAKKIAQEIVKERGKKPIETTFDLKNIIYSLYKPIKTARKTIDPATLTFQALRVFVNDELINLKDCLNKILKMSRVGARIVIVSFQGLENCVVKEWYALNRECLRCVGQVVPMRDEIVANPRCRSARLRAYEYTGF